MKKIMILIILVFSPFLNADHIYKCKYTKWLYTSPEGVTTNEKELLDKYMKKKFDFAHYGDELRDTSDETYSYLRTENNYELFRIDDDKWIDDTIYINQRDKHKIMKIRHNEDGAINTWKLRCSVEYAERIIFK